MPTERIQAEPHTAFLAGLQDGWLQPQHIGTRLTWESDFHRDAEAVQINNDWYGYGAKIGQWCGRNPKVLIGILIAFVLIELFYPTS